MAAPRAWRRAAPSLRRPPLNRSVLDRADLLAHEGQVGAYTITVEFRLKPGTQAAFRRAVDANALASVRDEPGCRRFDVLEPAGELDRILLYEIYDDRGAFDAHLASPHFAKFQAETAEMVSTKEVAEYDLVCEGSRERAGLSRDPAARTGR